MSGLSLRDSSYSIPPATESRLPSPRYSRLSATSPADLDSDSASIVFPLQNSGDLTSPYRVPSRGSSYFDSRRKSRRMSKQLSQNTLGSTGSNGENKNLLNLSLKIAKANMVNDHVEVETPSASSSNGSEDDLDNSKSKREKLTKPHGLRRRNKKSWFNYANIVAMPVPRENDEWVTGHRSTKTRVHSWWQAEEYKSVTRRIKEKKYIAKLNHVDSNEALPAVKRYQPRPHKVCFVRLIRSSQSRLKTVLSTFPGRQTNRPRHHRKDTSSSVSELHCSLHLHQQRVPRACRPI
jgi:hypothetical protein